VADIKMFVKMSIKKSVQMSVAGNDVAH
jgi:hypothetical protein